MSVEVSADTPMASGGSEAAQRLQVASRHLEAGAFEEAIEQFTACLWSPTGKPVAPSNAPLRGATSRPPDGACAADWSHGQGRGPMAGSIEPDAAQAFRGRALALVQLKRWQAAAQDFSKARELDPDTLDNWVGLGLSLASEGQVYRAIAVFDDLLAKHPRYVRGHIQAGLLYYRICATAKGRRHLETALACRPSLEERRLIERILREQAALDQRRYYRPDFDALRRGQQESLLARLALWLRRFAPRAAAG